ncbi:MAG: F0F1 ATP synthase subunit epsilon [Acidobacteria bacterium]|nr:MAG: F0F1 ATP synthase subunit epsilon [Acidobacteriota bacterium]
MSPLPQSIRLEIVTPEQRLVNEVVDEVVLPGSEGSLGVLPGHTPLLSTLGIGWLMYRRGDLRRYLAIAWGFVEVLPDRVSVLAEIAERAETIDRERARKARERALERLRGRVPGTDFERALIALQKAVIRIQVAEGAGPHEPA